MSLRQEANSYGRQTAGSARRFSASQAEELLNECPKPPNSRALLENAPNMDYH